MAGRASGQVMVSDKAACSTIAWSSEALMHSSSLVRSSLSDSLWKRASAPDLKDGWCSGGPAFAAMGLTKDSRG